MILRPQTSLAGGRYIVQRHVDSGAMADVYLATDTQRMVNVALKVLRSELSLDEYFEGYFRREATVLQSLQHPNIVRLYELARDGTLLFLVMDYISGPTLQQYLFANKLLPTSTALHIARALATALDFAHSKHVIHRDLKPSNVLLADNGTILLSDFGVARVAGGTTTVASRVGTLAYMSPEQINLGDITRATDQYALAILVWELLTGRRPFMGLTPGLTATTLADRVVEEHLQHPPPAGMLPEELADPLTRALHKHPEWRFPTCAALLEALSKAPGVEQLAPETWLKQLQTYTTKPPAPPEPPPPQPKPKPPIAAWVLGICLFVATVTGLAMSYFIRLDQQTASFATATAVEATAAAGRTEAAMLLATSFAPHTPTPTKTATATVTRTPTATPTPTKPPLPTKPPPTATYTPYVLQENGIAACGPKWAKDRICDDPESAMLWFRQLADTGDLYATNSMGFLRCGNKFATQYICADPEKALHWFLMGANRGNKYDIQNVIQIYCGPSFYVSPATCADPASAQPWLQRGADAGEKWSMNALAILLRKAGDKSAACQWWRKAADLGETAAQSNLKNFCPAG